MAQADATLRAVHEAMRLGQSGRAAEAIRILRSGREGVLRHPAGQDLLGRLLFEANDVEGAVRAFDAVVALAPNFADGHVNRGVALQRLGRLPEALAAYETAVHHVPRHGLAHFNRGNVLKLLGRPAEAALAFDAALAAAPGMPEVHLNRGRIRLELRDFAAALADFETVLAARPRSADAATGAATALHHLARNADALAMADAALRAEPGRADAALVRGRILMALARDEEALSAFAALRGHADVGAKAEAFRAAILLQLGRDDEALAAADAAVAAVPDDPQGHEARALALLTRGDYQEGFAEQEWRLSVAGYDRLLPGVPLWAGEPLAGRNVVMVTEQGIGDTLQFMRYARLLTAGGAEVTGLVQSPLLALARSFPGGGVTWADTARGLGEADFQIPMLSLPHRFGTLRDTVPAGVPYLFADPDKAAAWATRLGSDGFRVGINWQGNPNFANDRRRSVPLAAFAPLAAIPGVRLISLQAVNGLDQLAALGGAFAVEQPGPVITDNPDGLSEIAAAIAHLDLVVTSDTAVAHLAGALGARVWLATGFAPDWRWGRTGDTSPWYPTMRLFRQPAPGDWGSVFAAMAAEMEAAASRQPGGAP